MTLPRRLTLTEDEQLGIEPVETISSLRGQCTVLPSMALPANEDIVLDRVSGNAIEIVAEIDTQGAPMIELNVLRSPNREEYTRIMIRHNSGNRRKLSTITIDNTRSSILPEADCRPPETAPLNVEKDDAIELRVFVDRSIVEAFVNGIQCAAIRVYPGRKDSIGVSLRAQGNDALLRSLHAYQMKNIYQ